MMVNESQKSASEDMDHNVNRDELFSGLSNSTGISPLKDTVNARMVSTLPKIDDSNHAKVGSVC